MTRKSRNAEGDASLADINDSLHAELNRANRVPENSVQSVQDVDNGWKPLSDKRRSQVAAQPTEFFYVDPSGRKKRGVEQIIPRFPPLSKAEEVETVTTPEPKSIIIESPTFFSEAQWLAAIESIPNFEGNKNKSARFMYDIANGIKAINRKQEREQNEQKYKAPTVVIYHGKNKDKIGIHYQASTNQIVISSSYLAQYSRFNETDRIILRSDVRGNETVFDGRIRNWAKLIGIEEATHAVTHQRDGITSFVENRKKVNSLAEYDSRDEEYEALLEQLAFAQQEKMDKETITILTLRIRLAKQLRLTQGKKI